MFRIRPYYCLFLLSILYYGVINGQDSLSTDYLVTKYRVGGILISGNRVTRPEIIKRELRFQEASEYSPALLSELMEAGRRQLMNTGLFNHVLVAVAGFSGDTVDIKIEVKERWYVFPVPYFKPVDRNLNQWLVEQKASFDRVNYGAKLSWNNITGRNDKFRLWLISGYTRQFSFGYDRLYFDRKMKLGFNSSFVYGKNREINYNTVNDKQVFLKDPDDYVRHFISGQAGLGWRPAINTRHSIGIGFSSEEVQDTIVSLNPDFFKPGRNRIGYPSIYYNLNWFHLDYIPYPTSGSALRIILSKNGLNSIINLWQLHVNFLTSLKLSDKTFLNFNSYAGLKLPFKQPWFNRRFLGYGETYMQGYEYNVIDGVAGGYFKVSLNRELLNLRLHIPRGKNKPMAMIPFRVYGKIYGNTGYVHNPDPGDNDLCNRMLYSGGFGLDIVTLYDVVVRMEWSFNQLGQNGLFLHRKNLF